MLRAEIERMGGKRGGRLPVLSWSNEWAWAKERSGDLTATGVSVGKNRAERARDADAFGVWMTFPMLLEPEQGEQRKTVPNGCEWQTQCTTLLLTTRTNRSCFQQRRRMHGLKCSLRTETRETAYALEDASRKETGHERTHPLRDRKGTHGNRECE